MRAFLLEGPGRMMLASKERTDKIKHALALIQEKYPEIIVAESGKFKDTEFINTLVIHVPDPIAPETLEREFPCWLTEVLYEPKSS